MNEYGRESSEYPLTAEKLTRKFNGFTAVDSLSFRVRRGSILALIGPNGAGKTTTVRMLCGLLKPTSGSATVGGFDIAENPEGVKSKIGYMSQEFSLYEDLTVDENMNFFGGIYGLEADEIDERKNWVNSLMNIKNIEGRIVSGLPRGWKQKLALSCAVLHRPDIVFLDEPTSGVDPIIRRNFWKIIRELSGMGVTLIVTTHYMDEVAYSDTIILMDKGSVIAGGSEQNVINNYFTGKMFSIITESTSAAMDLLEEHKLVNSVFLFGNGIRINTGDEDEFAQVLRNLKGEGIKLKDTEEVSPTLEDVFVKLTERTDYVESD